MLSNNQQKDQQYNWHPYTQHQTAKAPIVITKGKDAILWDENDREYIDAIGSWWANPHGHSNPKIAKAISDQINTLEHVLFGGYTHPKAIELSEKLIQTLPHFKKVFYSDNGSTAVEVSLKMALQYFLNKGEKKSTCVAFEGGFHGDTFGAMSASGIGLFSEQFSNLCLPVERIPVPKESNFKEVEHQFIEILKSKNVYAFIFEPLVQGANGMNMYKPKYLDSLIKIAKEYNVITIADEVMTGFGRTGKLFATDYLTEKPDIICLSKALTGGFIPMAATLTTQEIFDAFYDTKIEKAFFHGHTFMANPAGCAASIASLEISKSEETQQNINRIQQKYNEFIVELQKFRKIKNIRSLGVILAFEIENEEENSYYGDFRNQLYNHFLKHRIILRPIGNTLYFLPPYCITNVQLDIIFKITLEFLQNYSNHNT